MTVTLNLPDHLESALRSHALAAGQDVETFVQHVVAERLAAESEPSASRRKISREDFAAYIRDTVARHGISTGNMNDSRESIYEGRGE